MSLEFLIIHCTDTPFNRPVTRADIELWHTGPRSQGHRGWSKVGYSDLFPLEGGLVNLSPFDQDDDKEAWEITNGVRGLNSIAHHIVYAGGRNHLNRYADTRTPNQKRDMSIYLKYALLRWPHVKIAGHNQFDPRKSCPGFDVPQWCRAIGIKEKNIYMP